MHKKDIVNLIRECITEMTLPSEEDAGIEDDFDSEQMAAANKTSRNSPAVGAKAVVPRAVLKIANKNHSILDFGAGKDAAHASALRNGGFNVVAYDFGSNVSDGIHDANALLNQYDIVYASNVLNTQGSEAMLLKTLTQIRKSLGNGGKFIFNFPKSPRYGAYTDYPSNKEATQYLIRAVTKIFGSKNIQDVKKSIGTTTPVYVITV